MGAGNRAGERVLSRANGRILSGIVVALLISLLVAACNSGPRPTPANVLLIVIDTLRASNLSYRGYSRKTSPTLDDLASRSYVFENTISVGGNTPTAMAGIMTGRLPKEEFSEEWPVAGFGMSRFYEDEGEAGLPRKITTLAERMRSAGYKTAGYITNPYLKSEYHFDRGFDIYREIFRETGVPYGVGEAVTKGAIEFLGSSPGAPFFLYLHYMDTHGPYYPPSPYLEMYGGRPYDPPTWERWENSLHKTDRDAPRLLGQMTAIYDGAISYVDACIADVLRGLERSGRADDTMIVVAADHGEEFLEHGGTTHKGTLYGELVRVPLIISVPGTKGRRIGELVRNFDLTPTVLDLAGVETDGESFDARSLRPIIEQNGELGPLFGHASFVHVRMLRSPAYKLLEFRDGSREFYNIRLDPGEAVNLYAKKSSRAKIAGIAESMSQELARLDARLAEDSQPGAVGNRVDPGAETLEQLRSLGYVK